MASLISAVPCIYFHSPSHHGEQYIIAIPLLDQNAIWDNARRIYDQQWVTRAHQATPLNLRSNSHYHSPTSDFGRYYIHWQSPKHFNEV